MRGVAARRGADPRVEGRDRRRRTRPTVYNFLAPTENQLALRLTGGTDDGFVPSGGIESAIVTPDLLFKELDVNAGSISEHAEPIVSQPK